MLSYVHSFHAGNFADTFKHTCLLAILESLCKKEKPFTVIDTHAASGVYDINDERLLKTGEAKEGILKLLDAQKKGVSLNEALANYLSLEKEFLEQNTYAGSPKITEHFLREKDTFFAVEKHPEALANLKNCMSKKAKVIDGDSYESLKALTPPLVKRGLILMDPSYEDASDYSSVKESLCLAMQKWNTAIIALWYPLLARRKNETRNLLSNLEDFAKIHLPGSETFHSELIIKNPEEMDEESKSHLYGSGMFFVNPPYLLREKVEESKAILEKIYSV